MSYPFAIQHLSPNHNSREGASIDFIVLHHTAMASPEDALKVLTDPENKISVTDPEGKHLHYVNNPVSAHYLIGKNGTVWQLVQDEEKAWHAGVSYWRDKKNLNAQSIGIELDNTGEEPFPDPMMGALVALTKYLTEEYKISKWNILSHSEIAPRRKIDPSYHFDWKMLAEKGIGYFPAESGTDNVIFIPEPPKKKHDEVSKPDDGIIKLQHDLAIWGYNLNATGVFDVETSLAVRAFNRRYCPETFEGSNSDPEEVWINGVTDHSDKRWMWTYDAEVKLADLLQHRGAEEEGGNVNHSEL